MYKYTLRCSGVFALGLILNWVAVCFLYVICFILYCVLVKYVSCIVIANKPFEPWTISFSLNSGSMRNMYTVSLSRRHGKSFNITGLWWVKYTDRSPRDYNDVIMGAIVTYITSLTIVYSTVYSGADQRKHQSSASLAFMRWIPRTNGQ